MKKSINKFFAIVLAVILLAVGAPLNASATDVEGEVIYTEMIAPQYDDARNFSEGLAAVKRGDKWGYINEDGEVVIDFQYDRAHSFSEGKALIEIHETDEDGWFTRNYFIITPDNKVNPVIDFHGNEYKGFDIEMYDSTYYNDYIFIPADSITGTIMIDENGYAFDIAPYPPTEGLLSKFNHYTTLDDDKYVVLYGDLGFVSAAPFNQGMAPVLFEDPQDKNGAYWTFLKKDGTLWSGPRFYNYYAQGVNTFHSLFNENSLASLKDIEGKWGAVNKEGETILPFKYEQLRIFTEGVAAFSENGKFGYIDIHGNAIIAPQYDDVSAFHNGLALVRDGKNTYIIDKTGQQVKGTENIPVESYFREDGTDDNGEVRYVIYPPGESILIKENNQYGFGKMEYIEKVVPVTGVQLNAKTITLEEEAVSEPLLPVISPTSATNKNVTWSSDDEQIATVNTHGIVTAKSAGTTLITVTTEDGGHIATTEVTVTKPDPYEAWEDVLTHQSASHSWTITFSQEVDESTVDNNSVYILDQKGNKVDFIQAETKQEKIILANKGSFQMDETYWIIIEDTVNSTDGKQLGKGIKAQFKIE